MRKPRAVQLHFHVGVMDLDTDLDTLEASAFDANVNPGADPEKTESMPCRHRIPM